MAKVAVNTGSIGETSYRADGLFGNEVNERDIIDLRNSSHKVQDYKRLLEREFNKAVAGEVRGEEGEWEIIKLGKVNVASKFYSSGRTLFRTAPYGANHIIVAEQSQESSYDSRYNSVVQGISGQYYKCQIDYNTDYNFVYLNHEYGDVTSDFTNGVDAIFMVVRQSTRKKSNTTLHCDIIGNPANYYRGQTYIDSTTQDIAIDDVVWAKTASGGGTAGNFYKALTAQSAIDLATQDYSNATNWTDLGSDWDGAGSWRTGVSGTPLIVGENGEDYIPDGTAKSIKLSKKVIDHVLFMHSNDNGVTWSANAGGADSYYGSNWNTTENTIGNNFAIPDGQLQLVFYETHTNMTENAVNSEVIEFGFMQLLTSISYNKLSESLINKVAYTQGSTEWDRKYPLDRTSIRLSDDKLHMNENYKHPILSPWPSTLSRPVKIMPFITKENNKAYINMVFKEIKYEPTSGDDEIFRVVDNVSTTIDDNGNTVLIGQKRIELPYFIEDKE